MVVTWDEVVCDVQSCDEVRSSVVGCDERGSFAEAMGWRRCAWGEGCKDPSWASGEGSLRRGGRGSTLMGGRGGWAWSTLRGRRGGWAWSTLMSLRGCRGLTRLVRHRSCRLHSSSLGINSVRAAQLHRGVGNSR